MYEERLKRFFVAYQIDDKDDKRKSAFLLTAVSMEVYQTIKNLSYPDLPENKKFSELCGLLKQRFTPTLVIFRERTKFFEARQGEGESIVEWCTRLKKLATNCEFGDQLNPFLLNMFVAGLRRGPIFERLCEEEATSTLDNLLKIAMKRESTMQQRQVLEVHKIQPEQQKRQRKSEAKCYACGKGDHDFKKCQYKSYVCRNCDGKGHLAKVCPSKDKKFSNEKRGPKVNHLRINKLEVPPPVEMQVFVNQQMVNFEIDTGSPVNAISKSMYDQLFQDIPLNTDTKEEFVCYNGSGFRAVGTFKAIMKYKQHESLEEVFVFEGTRQPLFGRQTMRNWNLKIDFCFMSNNEEDGKKLLDPLLKKHASVFEGELGRFKHNKIHLALKEDTVPKFCKPRKIPLAFKEKVEAELDRLESSGIISKAPSSEAEWGTPLVPVLKKDSSLRLCADYRVTVNPFLMDDRHPFPVIEEIFAALHGGRYFSKLDLKNAYYQLEVDDETKKLLAWSTHRGVYWMNRLPFGTKPACSVFQGTLERVLQGCRGTVVYLDDVLVSGATVAEHLENLEQVLVRLKEAGFVLNKQKCEFFKRMVSYLGHVIDEDGLHKDPEKVRAILDVKAPADVKDVRAFVGLANYYAKFCSSLAQCLKPLYELLKDGVKFSWTDKQQKAFEKAKKLLSEDTVLAHYDPNLPVRLYCDASNEGIGAVITHVFPDKSERPISFTSRIFKKHETGYSVIDREALAIYYGINKFSNYLFGRHFELMTDHKPLTGLFSPKGIPTTAAGRLQRWAAFLANCDYEIRHVKGTHNVPADFLSRFPMRCEDDDNDEDGVSFLNFIEVETRSLVERKQIIVESRRDKLISRVVEYVQSEWPRMVQEDELKIFYQKRDELSVEEGVLLWGYRIVVPTKLRKMLLDELHQVHLGIVKMKSLARSYFWWPCLDRDIEDLGKTCELCIQQRPERNDPVSPWHLTSAPGDRVHVDHFSFRGSDFLVLIDNYSKWIEAFPVRTLTSKETIEKICEYISRFGSISTLVSDNGTAFTSDEFKDFCTSRGIKHLRTAPYSPCSNGAAENAVKTVKTALKKLHGDPAFQKKSTSMMINSYLEMYRASKHATTAESPFKLMFGREMRIRFDSLKVNAAKRQNDAAHKINGKKKQQIFDVGEIVYVRDYRNPKKVSWVRGKIQKKLGAVIYECSSDELGMIKRRTHQIQMYPYDDFEDDVRNRRNQTNQREVVNDEVDSDASYVSFEDEPEEDQTNHQSNGTYVTRYNRVVRPPRR